MPLGQRNPQRFPEDDLAKPLEHESLGRLLLGFFEYYGFNFDYTTFVVSVLSQGHLTKKSKGWASQQQKDMLSIEDPTNPSMHISTIVREPSLRMPSDRQRCWETHIKDCTGS